MRAQHKNWQAGRSIFGAANQTVVLAVLVVLMIPRGHSRGELTTTTPAGRLASVPGNPFRSDDADSDPIEIETSNSHADAAAYVPQQTPSEVTQVDFQAPLPNSAQPTLNAPDQPDANAKAAKDPCAAAVFKPLAELGISIAQPAGRLPTDHATACWDKITQTPGSLDVCRCWPATCYQWDATCFCHQPLYFEEINAERYGYQCGDRCCFPCECCLQPAASAAHFFATVPALPYCLLAEAPGECVYTLGHYRPGSCGVPLRWHWPPWDPVAAVTAASIYTGLIFAFP